MSKNVLLLTAMCCGFLIASAAFGLTQDEGNWWPGGVRLYADAAQRADELTAGGPFFSDKITAAEHLLAFRPLMLEVQEFERDVTSLHFLYPLFNYYDYEDHSHWHVLNLLRGSSWNNGTKDEFQLWPFIFKESGPDPDNDAFAVWPIGGSLRNFFGRTRLDFWAWPLFVRSERLGEIRYSIPWPFVQWRNGEASGGALWPLYGHFERTGQYNRRFALWPLIYDYRDQLDHYVTRRRFGVLPFYATETADGLEAETFVWPFFGYTQEWAPRPVYDETRYFWPLLVQGRGEEHHINRWMPFFTYEREKEAEKWWYLWPLLKQEEIDIGFLTRYRTQFLFFLYRDELQSDGADFAARRQYLWPFYSYWNDGNGRRQIQALDPFTVFMPSNRRFQETWTTLFAIFRYDERNGTKRQSWLWNLVVAEKSPDARRLTVGPIFQSERSPTYSRWRILRGLVARTQKNGDSKWSFFWLSPKEDSP